MNTKNLFTKQRNKKLENCHVRKYQVKKIICNHAVKLDLPSNLYVHPVFHVNLFEPVAIDDPYPDYVQPPGPPIKVDGETKYEVTAIVDSQLFGRTKKLQYRVQWTGYAELNWEDALNITNAADLLHNFPSRYPNKPGPIFQIWELAELIPREGDNVTYEAWEAFLLFLGFSWSQSDITCFVIQEL